MLSVVLGESGSGQCIISSCWEGIRGVRGCCVWGAAHGMDIVPWGCAWAGGAHGMASEELCLWELGVIIQASERGLYRYSQYES